MKRLWEVLLRLSEGEKGASLSCEDCYMLLDYLSDLMAEGYRPKELMPLADKYLRRCPECMSEYIQAVRELLPDPEPVPAIAESVTRSAGIKVLSEK